MDSKDFHLLAALYGNARQSYRSLGRQVSLSAPAVRERLKGLENRGIIQGYWVSPDPSIFDREDLLVFFQRENSREDAVKALETKDVAWVAWKVDGGLTVQVWPKNRNPDLEDLKKAVGEDPSGQAWVEHHNHQPPSLADWRIMDALIEEPRIELKQLCETTGLSPKTVRKHLEKMIREEIVYVSPKLGVLADSGELVYHLAVTGKIGMVELVHILGDAILVNESQKPQMKYLFCRANDLADVTSRVGLVGKSPDVESVRITLNRELLVGASFVQSLVRERVSNEAAKLGRWN